MKRLTGATQCPSNTWALVWRQRYPRNAWRTFVQKAEDEQFVFHWRTRACNGRPLGSDRFIARLEAKLNLRLRDPQMGRPRKARAVRSRKGKSRLKAGARATKRRK